MITYLVSYLAFGLVISAAKMEREGRDTGSLENWGGFLIVLIFWPIFVHQALLKADRQAVLVACPLIFHSAWSWRLYGQPGQDIQWYDNGEDSWGWFTLTMEAYEDELHLGMFVQCRGICDDCRHTACKHLSRY